IYMLPIPTDSLDVFKTGFKILANWAGKLSLNGDDIDSERGIIVEEDRQRGKNAQERMSKKLFPILLNNSRYEKRIPIGSVDLLQKFTHDKIRNFYSDWYRPNLQGIVAVGDFDEALVEKLIKDNFSELKNPASPKPRVYYDLPDNKETLIKVITDQEQPYNIALIIFKHKKGVTRTTTDLRNDLIYSMINSMLGSRLTEIMQKKDAPFLFAQSSYGAFQGGLIYGVNAFQTVIVAKSSTELERSIATGMAESERMARFGFVRSEMDVAVKNILAGNEKSYLERNKTTSAAFVDAYVKNFTTGNAMPSIEFRYAEIKKHLASITLQEINTAAKNLISKENRIIIVQAPEKEKEGLPDEARIIAAVNNAGNGLTAYVDNAIATQLLDKKPVPGKILSERKIASADVTELILSNGVKVILKKTDFKNDQIILSSFSKGGSSLAGNDDYLSAANASLISSSGVGAFDPAQLNKFLAGNTARVSSYISDEYQGYSGSASPKDIETALQLVYAYATVPRKDAELYNKNISDFKVSLRNKNTNPQSVFSDTVQAVLSNYHKRGMPLNEADLEKMSIDKSFAFYKDRFADASGQTFVIVGNFELEKIKPLLETYIASLPSINRKENFVDNGVRMPLGKVSKTVYKGLEDKATVELYLHGPYTYSVENRLELEALRSALEFKILERLREKESGVYSPNVSISIQRTPSHYYALNISFSSSKENVEKLIAASLDEVEKIRQNGVSEDDLKKFKAEENRIEELNQRNNSYWINYISNRMKYEEDLNQFLGYKERVE
ncbi:MAG: insulinase family protein, partial [Pedobacter sp.]